MNLNELWKAPVRGMLRALGYCPVRIAGDRFKGDPYHVGFWREVDRGRWEPGTLDALREHLKPDSVFVDVGAWIGPLTMFAARRAAKVFCIEPDYHAYQCLLWNIQLNHLRNVIPFHAALGAYSGVRRLGIRERMGNSLTTFLVTEDTSEQIDVLCLRWSDWIDLSGVGRVSFLKIDIEGGEFEVLPSMKDYLRAEKPIVHLSMHAPFLAENERDSRIREIADVMSAYGGCYDESRRHVPVREFVDASRKDFCTFLFME